MQKYYTVSIRLGSLASPTGFVALLFANCSQDELQNDLTEWGILSFVEKIIPVDYGFHLRLSSHAPVRDTSEALRSMIQGNRIRGKRVSFAPENVADDSEALAVAAVRSAA
jgi:hypothetical protein